MLAAFTLGTALLCDSLMSPCCGHYVNSTLVMRSGITKLASSRRSRGWPVQVTLWWQSSRRGCTGSRRFAGTIVMALGTCSETSPTSTAPRVSSAKIVSAQRELIPAAFKVTRHCAPERAATTYVGRIISAHWTRTGGHMPVQGGYRDMQISSRSIAGLRCSSEKTLIWTVPHRPGGRRIVFE